MAFAMQFQHPLFSVFAEVYRVGHPEGKHQEAFRLPRAPLQELQVIAVLGLLASTSSKTQVSETVYGADASPSGAGIVQCKVGKLVAQELFRRAQG